MIVAITSMLSVLFMLFIAALVIFIVSTQVDVNVVGFLLYAEPKADTTLLTFLDSTSGEHSMKELLSYAIFQGGTDFTLDGQEIDLKATSAGLMGEITNKAHRLSMEFEEGTVDLSSKGKPELVEHSQVETVLYAWGMDGRLTLVIAK